MKILIFGSNFYPEPIGIPRYTTDMAIALQKKNIEVTVLASPPLYPDWKRKNGFKYFSYSTEKKFGLSINRVPVFVPSQNSFFQRILYEISFFVFSLPKFLLLNRKKFDKVIITAPPFFLPLYFYLLGNKICKILIIKDLQVDISKNIKYFNNKLIIKLIEYIEKLTLIKSDIIFAVSNNMVKKIKTKTSQTDVNFFPDWVDTSILIEKSKTEINILKKSLGIEEDKVLIGYSGNIARKQGLNLLVDIFEKNLMAKFPKLNLVICGNGSMKPELEKYIREKSIKNIIMVPLQSEENLPTLLSMIDIHFIPQINEVSDLVMPGKIFNIMSCSRPLIATANKNSNLYDIIERTESGFCIERSDIGKMVNKIELLINDIGLRKKLGINGRNFVKREYEKKLVLENFFKKIGIE